MALILSIESSTSVCSVALAMEDQILAERETRERYAHAEKLAVFINEVMQDAARSLKELDAIAVSGGPGSYTGLRIGVSSAKGLCFALDKPMIAVDTLTALAHAGRGKKLEEHSGPFKGLLIPMIDARRMEVYTSIFDQDLNKLKTDESLVLDPDSFSEELKEHHLYFFGDGSGKFKSLIDGRENTFFLDDIYPSAINVAALAYDKFRQGNFENTALYEPFYLKEFRPGPKAS